MRKVYLDHSDTTPIDSRVVQAMLPYLTEKFGNASSIHQFGQEARGAVDKARRQVAALINARANEIVFTSGGTEANNLAIRGICEAAKTHGRHIITSVIEHPSVRGVVEYLEKNGWAITRLPVYDDGLVRVDDVRAFSSVVYRADDGRTSASAPQGVDGTCDRGPRARCFGHVPGIQPPPAPPPCSCRSRSVR